jgi:fructose-1,6-bisphosphatase/sedoheptulose 1,7-bisphosphatase-like protein
MALKADRIELLTDVSFFMNTVAERGGVVSVGSTGSGVSMDDANAVVAYASAVSGAKPLGVLLTDVVNLDLTRQHINWHKDEVQVGGKVTLLRQGQVTTNMVTGSPSAGSDAYVGVSGLIGTSSTNSVKIGQFLSSKDADGYAKVSVNIA